MKLAVVLETTITELWVVAAGVSFGVSMFVNRSFDEKAFPIIYNFMVTGH